MPAAAAALAATVPAATMETAAMEAASVGAPASSAAMKLGRSRFTRCDKGSHKGQRGQARYHRSGYGISHC
jgi:hypothetical protein